MTYFGVDSASTGGIGIFQMPIDSENPKFNLSAYLLKKSVLTPIKSLEIYSKHKKRGQYYGRVQILPHNLCDIKWSERGFFHVMACAENLNFTTYSINEFSVQICSNKWSRVKTQILPHRKLNFTTIFRIKVCQWLIMW